MGKAIVLAVLLVILLAVLLKIKKYFKGSCRRNGCCALRAQIPADTEEKKDQN